MPGMALVFDSPLPAPPSACTPMHSARVLQDHLQERNVDSDSALTEKWTRQCVKLVKERHEKNGYMIRNLA